MKLSIQQVTKTYSNGVRALNDISLDLRPGMFGLLGPNGAGKSTLMRTIATLQQPDSGQIHFSDKDIFANKTGFRKSLGYLPQEFGVYPGESAYRLLDYFALLKGIVSKKERIIAVDRVLEITNLLDAKKKNVSTFSGGMRQRFGIAQLLLNQPKVIIVDEPTAGLDPAERARFLHVLRGIGSENIVLFSTHLVEDVRELCHDMAIINKGRLLSQVPPKAATEDLRGKIWETTLGDQALTGLNQPHIKLSEHYNDANQPVARLFAEQGHSAFSPAPPRLEDYYFLTLKKS